MPASPARIRGDHVGDAGRVVLEVEVEHHHDVRVLCQGGVVARLLGTAVAEVLLVDEDLEAEQLATATASSRKG
jgi:hypothetical protein